MVSPLLSLFINYNRFLDTYFFDFFPYHLLYLSFRFRLVIYKKNRLQILQFALVSLCLSFLCFIQFDYIYSISIFLADSSFNLTFSSLIFLSLFSFKLLLLLAAFLLFYSAFPQSILLFPFLVFYFLYFSFFLNIFPISCLFRSSSFLVYIFFKKTKLTSYFYVFQHRCIPSIPKSFLISLFCILSILV